METLPGLPGAPGDAAEPFCQQGSAGQRSLAPKPSWDPRAAILGGSGGGGGGGGCCHARLDQYSLICSPRFPWAAGGGCWPQAGADGVEMGCPAPRGGGLSVCLSVSCLSVPACSSGRGWLLTPVGNVTSSLLSSLPSVMSPGQRDRASHRHRDRRAQPCPRWVRARRAPQKATEPLQVLHTRAWEHLWEQPKPNFPSVSRNSVLILPAPQLDPEWN